MSFLDRIRECDNAGDRAAYLPFRVGAVRVGWVHREFAPLLDRFPDTFLRTDDAVALSPRLADYASRTAAVDAALRALDADGHFSGWRGEPYPVGTGFRAPPLFEVERAAVPRFGVTAYGIHVHGYVREGADILMWIGRRADDKPTYPGELDQMIAGGQPVGIGLMENVVKEAREEAGVPAGIARTAKPVGAISYCREEPGGLKPDVMFVYDLELPRDFVPRDADGEMAGFRLLPAAEVMRITADTGEFKFNCAVANIDFFIRHGLLAPDHPDYVEMLRGMHR